MKMSDGLSGEPEIAGFSRMSLNAASSFGEYGISESIRDHTIYLLRSTSPQIRPRRTALLPLVRIGES